MSYLEAVWSWWWGSVVLFLTIVQVAEWVLHRELPVMTLRWKLAVAVTLLIAAQYVAWANKRDEAESEKQRASGLQRQLDDRRANLVGEVLHSYLVGNLLIALIEITNTGGTPSEARDFALAMRNAENKAFADNSGGTVVFRLGIGANNTDAMFLLNELIQSRASVQTIDTGRSVRGWVMFEFRASGVPTFDEVRSASIRFIEAGTLQPKFVALSNLERIPPLPNEIFNGYPDITSPFRDRDVINGMTARARTTP